ncbi:MAG: glycosyltransferase family 39 protein [Chloroflexota bacterium]
MDLGRWANHKLLPLGLFLLAFLPRLASLERFVTLDELMWVYRSISFREALLSQDWANTIQTGHPGVTTTWFGGLGVQLSLWLRPETAVNLDWVQQIHWFSPLYAAPMQQVAPFLTPGRLGVILFSSLAIVGVYALLRRLTTPIPALFAALALIFAPFYTGLSGMLHTDAIQTSVVLLTFLLLLPSATPRRAALAGLTTAVAVATKLPGLLLVGLVPLILLSQNWQERNWKRLIQHGVWWFVPFVLGLVFLLPGLVGAPTHVFSVLRDVAGDEVAKTQSIVWLGSHESDVPPLLFYPLAFLLRLAPMAMIGIGLGLFRLMVVGRQQDDKSNSGLLEQIFAPQGQRSLMLLFGFWFLLFSILFIVGLSLSARVFARYLLPVVMIWSLWGGLALGAWVEGMRGKRQGQTAVILIALFAIFSLVHLRYPLFAYNWLLGGQRTAGYLMKTGFQETHSAATRWLADQGAIGTLYTDNVPPAAPFYDGEIIFFNEKTAVDLRPTDWLILPLDEFIPPYPATGLLNEIQTRFTPQERIRVGTRQVGVYTGISAADLGLADIVMAEVGERFGEAVWLESGGGTAVDNNITVRLRWQIIQPAPYRLLLTVEDDSRHIWFRNEYDLKSRINYPSAQWEAGQLHTVDYELPLPVDMPPGDYHVKAQLFDAAGSQQGVFDLSNQFIGNEASVASVWLTQPVPQPSVEVPNRLDISGELVGYDNVPAAVGTGEAVVFDVWWRQEIETAVSGSLVLQIGDQPLDYGLETAVFSPNNLIHLRPTWTLPPDFPAGEHPVALQWQVDDEITWAHSLGSLTVESRNRIYTLLSTVTTPLNIQFAALAKLQAIETEQTDSGLRIQLVWQATEPTQTNYTTFVHVRDAAGNLLAQQDRSPVVPTSEWVAGQVVVDEFVFGGEVGAGTAVAVGLYDSSTGQRLPVFSAIGQALPDAQYLAQIR